mgnify:CR=1 FL=1
MANHQNQLSSHIEEALKKYHLDITDEQAKDLLGNSYTA